MAIFLYNKFQNRILSMSFSMCKRKIIKVLFPLQTMLTIKMKIREIITSTKRISEAAFPELVNDHFNACKIHSKFLKPLILEK